VKKQTGSDLNAACLRLLDLCGVTAWRSNNMPVFDAKIGRYRKFTGRKGVSDIIAILRKRGYDGTLYGVFLGVETKADKDRLSADQKKFRDDCQAAGGRYLVVRTIADMEIFLRGEGLLR